jgi:hypothetical protein
MKRITVFAVQVQGPMLFPHTSSVLGQTLAKKNIELVYGGANVD